MVFLKNNTEFTIKVTVEPDLKYNCILESFRFPSCKGWAGCECTGKIDLCPEVLNIKDSVRKVLYEYKKNYSYSNESLSGYTSDNTSDDTSDNSVQNTIID